MEIALDLRLEELELLETPMTDMEWGLAAGGLFMLGVGIGVAVVLT